MSRQRSRKLVPHPPEWNLIQAPELIRRLQSRLGLRQAHIAPALAEGVQPTVVLDSLHGPDPYGKDRNAVHGYGSQACTGTTYGCVMLTNLAGSGRIVMPRRLDVYGYGAGFVACVAKVILSSGLVTLTNVSPGVAVYEDMRQSGLAAGRITCGENVAAAASQQYQLGLPAAFDPATVTFPNVVLPAGHQLCVMLNILSATAYLSASFQWDELPEVV